jgi:hypothetical protein
VHGIAPEDVHFHEVGVIDALADIVAVSAGFAYLGASISSAPLPLGTGLGRGAHGTFPLPAPAVVELVQGLPTVPAGLVGETVTLTGAALVAANVSTFATWLAIRPVSVGFGAGTREWPDRPNLLRVVLGDAYGAEPTESAFVLMETNVDDASGEVLGRAVDVLLASGALDAWTTPIGMKKNRPGFLLAALARAADADRLARSMLAETSSLGVRVRPCDRIERPRRVVDVDTPYGRVPVKVADGDGLPETIKPEHDVVVALAEGAGVTARQVYAAALRAFETRR